MTNIQRLEFNIIESSNNQSTQRKVKTTYDNTMQEEYEKEAKKIGYSDFPQETKNSFKHNREFQIQEAL